MSCWCEKRKEKNEFAIAVSCLLTVWFCCIAVIEDAAQRQTELSKSLLIPNTDEQNDSNHINHQ